MVLAALASCADELVQDAGGERTEEAIDEIRIGSVSTADVLSISAPDSRTTTGTGDVKDAELVDWLLEPLYDGFTIVYNKTSNALQERMATLRLKKNAEGTSYATIEEEVDGVISKLADYSFNRIENSTGGETAETAKWFGNGKHSFRGVYAPKDMLSDGTNTPAADLVTDQSDDSETGNYTNLVRYSSIPANYSVDATVKRIKLPFYHRLARVLVFILINPDMGSNVTLEGYKKDASGNPMEYENASTTNLRFERVKVLGQVSKAWNDSKKRYTYTPQWAVARKVIPHFMAELGTYDVQGNLLDEDFILFQDISTQKYITSDYTDEWTAANNAYKAAYEEYITDNGIDIGSASDVEKNAAHEYARQKSGYSMTNYGKVPVYDIIVRPTYSTDDDIMYDEGSMDNTTNSIDFKLKLSNGLEYEKTFEFDLNANQMTTVYLRINREQIDYNSSGAETWVSNAYTDGYYGLNNENGNRLSLAGGSWQRAYRNSSFNPDITDGSKYEEDGENDHRTGEDGQYLTDATWAERFAEAHAAGAHHGDYFVLDNDITIDGSLLPEDFVFTGHLDARGHTITVTGRDRLFDGLNARYVTAQETDPSITDWEANVHRESNGGKTYWVPLAGYRAEVLNVVMSGARLFKEGATLGKTDADDVNGYVHNCTDYDGSKIQNIQDIPTYD